MKGIALVGLVVATVSAAGVVGALTNEQIVAAQVSEVNLTLEKTTAKLAQTAASTSPPAVCISPKLTAQACTAVAELEEAQEHALTTLAQIDAIDAGTSEWSLARRLDRVAWAAEANQDLFGIISPEYAGIISPELAATMTTEMAGIISPEIALETSATVGIISPEVAGIISPERTQELVSIISPEYAGLSAAQRAALDARLAAVVERAEHDLVLAQAARRALAIQN